MDKKSKNNQETIQKEDDEVKSFIVRLERLLEEKNNINFNIKKVFYEAESSWYDKTIGRIILALRKMDIDERIEQETFLKNYCPLGSRRQSF